MLPIAIIKSVLEDFELLIREKKATIIIEDNLPVIEANPFQMNQLFYNLIDNALKFSKPETAPVITITSSLQKDQSDEHSEEISSEKYYHFKLTDNGIGFEEKYSDHLFEIFRQLHNSGDYIGSGIGLATCKKIVLNQKGKIYAESIKNAGTTIHILLPSNQRYNS